MLNWLKNLLSRFLPPERKSLTVTVFARGMTLEEFRSFEDRVREVRILYKQSIMQDIFAVLHQHAPRGNPVEGNAIQAAIELGRKEGYQDCLEMLLAVANHAPTPKQEVEPDWGARERMRKEGLLA